MYRVCLIAALLAVSPALAAQSRREPTPAEAKVLTRFIEVMTPIFDRFTDPSWQVESNDFPAAAGDVAIAINAGLPLDDCVGGYRTWEVPPGSPRFNARLKPLYDRVQVLTNSLVAKLKARKNTATEAQEIARLNKQLDRLDEVTIDICGNSPNVETAALPPPDRPSLLSGVIAHKVPGDACGVDVPTCYVLVFGDWKTATLDRSAGLYNYHFVHPAATPYLENVVIKLHGAEDRILEMLKTVDWTRVNRALTR